jgi:protein SCO1/2
VQGIPRIFLDTTSTKPNDDYLVDHSIFFYFMDPDRNFVDAFGKSSTEADVIERVKREFEEWKAEKGRLV